MSAPFRATSASPIGHERPRWRSGRQRSDCATERRARRDRSACSAHPASVRQQASWLSLARGSRRRPRRPHRCRVGTISALRASRCGPPDHASGFVPMPNFESLQSRSSRLLPLGEGESGRVHGGRLQRGSGGAHELALSRCCDPRRAAVSAPRSPRRLVVLKLRSQLKVRAHFCSDQVASREAASTPRRETVARAAKRSSCARETGTLARPLIGRTVGVTAPFASARQRW